jgi:hypothetical protein
MPKQKKSLWAKLAKWKQIVLSSDAWPVDLVVPEQFRVPARAGVPLSGHDEDLHWQWELRRCQPGGRYVLRVWPYGCSTAHLDDRKGASLTVQEAWEFALTNSMPRCLMERIGLYRKTNRQRRRTSHDAR